MVAADLSNPLKARDHARSQAGTTVRAMPTIPAASARDLPPGVFPRDVVWDEVMAGGEYCGRVLKRGTRVRLTDLEWDACVSVIAFNADSPVERLNVADTVKVQWNCYLRSGSLLLSDMGRVLLSIEREVERPQVRFRRHLRPLPQCPRPVPARPREVRAGEEGHSPERKPVQGGAGR
jgi:uncharacterized protein